MSKINTPGAYLTDQNVFPGSVVEVATAIPAFIGYTEKAKNGLTSLINIPFKISSLAEYEQYFGKGPNPDFSLIKSEDFSLGISSVKNLKQLISINSQTKEKAENIENNLPNELVDMTKPENMQYYSLIRNDKFNLYYHLVFFFANGGGSCYIVSVSEGYQSDSFSYNALAGGLEDLVKEQEPTMVLIPEAVYLEDHECYNLQMAMLNHCGNMQNRIAILDIYNGDKSRNDSEAGDVIAQFREKIGTGFLNYGAAYYPWLNTSIVSEKDLGINAISNIEDLQSILKTEAVSQKDGKKKQSLLALSERITKKGLESLSEQEEIHKILLEQSTTYTTIMKGIVQSINLLPPSSAMAGVYTVVDSTGEVWTAPANVMLSSVVSPAVNISNTDQVDLNAPLDGKAVNAIRYFPGQGVLVWGARALDANSMDWRYINVRRTMIMLEESIKNAVKAFVFEPNTAVTWAVIHSMITNFLTDIWKRGGLLGATPGEAFNVKIGLGITMTSEDILEGLMKISVQLVVARPAEFIEILFQQQMQKK